MTSVLFVVCTFNPNGLLRSCINSMYDLHGADMANYKVVIVDNNSTDKSFYKSFELRPNTEIIFKTEGTYEFGAYKAAYEAYPAYDVYVCIQDSIRLENPLDYSVVTNGSAYIWYHDSGYESAPRLTRSGPCGRSHYDLALKILQESKLQEYQKYIDQRFRLAQHCSFVVCNDVLEDIVSTFTYMPRNKRDSENYERLFGLYFCEKQTTTYDLANFGVKTHRRRR